MPLHDGAWSHAGGPNRNAIAATAVSQQAFDENANRAFLHLFNPHATAYVWLSLSDNETPAIAGVGIPIPPLEHYEINGDNLYCGPVQMVTDGAAVSVPYQEGNTG